MIYITGDIHGSAIERFSYKMHPFTKSLNSNDYMIIAGDFGIPFGILNPAHNHKKDKYELNYMSTKPYTFIVLLGNHDDRDFIKTCPVVDKFNGSVRKMVYDGVEYNNIYLVDTPQILTIENHRMLFIPGADSHDIDDGILDPFAANFEEKKDQYKREGRIYYRFKHYSWWEDEDVDTEEVDLLLSETDDNHFDYVITHQCPADYLKRYNMYDLPSYSQAYLHGLTRRIDFDLWIHGHVHTGITYNNSKGQTFMSIYHEIMNIEDGGLL